MVKSGLIRHGICSENLVIVMRPKMSFEMSLYTLRKTVERALDSYQVNMWNPFLCHFCSRDFAGFARFSSTDWHCRYHDPTCTVNPAQSVYYLDKILCVIVWML
jgi:ribosomal protein L37AE/L43A